MRCQTDAEDYGDGTIAALARRRGLVLLAATLGMFLLFLDSGVNVALPAIAQDLNSSIQGVLWIIIVYQLVRVALLPTLGSAGDTFGLKAIFIGGLVSYLAGVAVVALAGSIPQMAALRAFQAVGAAMLWAAAPALVGRAFPAGERGRALGIMTAGSSAGLIGGPLFGGLLLDWWGWPAVFWMRLPIGVGALLVALASVRGDIRPVPQPDRRYDLAGASTLAGGLGLLSLALSLTNHGTGSTLLPYLLVGGVGLLGSFVAVEARSASPIIPLSLMSDRLFLVAVARGFLGHTSIFIIWFLFPFFMAERLALPAALMGVMLIITPLVSTFVSPISGWASDRVGTRWPVTGGLVLMAAGVWLVGRFQGGDPVLSLVGALMLLGLGFGLFQAPNYSSLMNSVPPERMGTAASVLAMATTLGTIAAVSLAGAFFSLRQQVYSGLAPGTAFDLAYRDTFMLFALIGLSAVAVSLIGGRREGRVSR